MTKTGIVLAGHGSHISAQTASIVWEQVDRLRALNAADEITAAFWKEAPSFQTVLDTLTADDITIVPLFTAHGYFTRTVIPTEMELTGAITRRAGRTIRYTEPLGAHPRLSDIVWARVVDAMRDLGVAADATAVAVIGHSTRRHPESRAATEAHAAALRELGIAAQVVAVYLDDTPEIADVYTLTDAPNLIAVPYFLALGSHVTIDVPGELGLASGETRATIHGRTVIYAPPVGIDAGLTDMILDLAGIENADSIKQVSQRHAPAWSGFPTAGRAALIEAGQRAGTLTFGELRLTRDCIHVEGDPAPNDTIRDPATLRARVREMPFRPLATSRDLPRGWRVEIDTPAMLHAVVETVYPGAVADWAAAVAGTLPVRALAATIARQTGNYRALSALDTAACAGLVARVCGGCVRHPTWHDAAKRDAVGAQHDSSARAEIIPCPEACNVWLSAALKEVEA